MYDIAINYTADDRRYIDGHRFMYGEIGEHVAGIAIRHPGLDRAAEVDKARRQGDDRHADRVPALPRPITMAA
jgi:hypothetical protein